MNSGYIYILQNKSLKYNCLKIGMTTRQPDIRVKELSSATGVAESFDLIFAYQVTHCRIAEKEIHEKLNPYRYKKEREFFIIPLKIAKKIVCKVCQKINESFGYFNTNPIIIDNQTNTCLNNDYNDHPELIKININQIVFLPIGISILSNEQKERIEIIAEIFKDFYPISYEKWVEGFSRDIDPEIEIKIWEDIGKAFVKIEYLNLNQEQQREAFNLLRRRSMISASKVMKEFKLKTLTKKLAKEILSEYEAQPTPIEIYSHLS